LNTILQEEIFINDESSTVQSSAPDWIFSEGAVNDKDPTKIQEIITLRCDHLLSQINSSSLFNDMDKSSLSSTAVSDLQIAQLESFPRIWISLVKCILLLPEKDIKWRTIQSLQSILKTAHWFYSYGSPPFSAVPNGDLQSQENGENDRPVTASATAAPLMLWTEFMSLQKVPLSPAL
jgi:hypothetical protein